MKIRDSIVQKFVVAMMSCFLTAAPGLSWGAVDVADRPLFLTANVDHNLMFVVDDSGSMDWEILAPGYQTNGYLFMIHPYSNSSYDGRRLYSGSLTASSNGFVAPYNERYYYLRSKDYNTSYYDPSATYEPWPDGKTKSFSNSPPSAALADPNFPNGYTVDLTSDIADYSGNYHYPAVFFKKITNGSVSRTTITYSCPAGYSSYGSECRKCTNSGFFGCNRWDYKPRIETSNTTTQQCDAITDNWYDNWRSNTNSYSFTGEAEALGPDGACLNKVELRESNAQEVLDVTGQTWQTQLQNFANWFTYYRRRHQVIRGAIGESVKDLENMRLGTFWLNDRSQPTMYSTSTADSLGTFLDISYDKFGSSYSAQGTPLRLALNAAGQYFKKTAVRGNLECRRNFTLLFSDGEANNNSGFTNTDNTVGNADKNADAPFANEASRTLGDIAYYYYHTPLASGGAIRLRSECGTGDQKPWMDCNAEHHMNTYTIGLGMKGQKYAGITHHKVRDAHDNPPDWSEVSNWNSDGNSAQIDDLYHAAVNGKGEYYDAKSTEELREALKSAVNSIVSELGSGSNVSFNTGTIEEGTRIYSAEFWSGSWVGTLKAQTLEEGGKVGTTVWNAAVKLDDQVKDLDTKPRNILTYNPVSGSVVSLAWNDLTTAWNGLSDSQKADLKNGGSDADGLARLKYILGDTSQDGTTFRARASVLGDIIHSSPVYVGKPSMGWPNSDPFGSANSRYSKFRSDKAGRQAVVYVGANDGMLHGFNADTGEEVLGFIPSFVYSTASNAGLHYLTNKSYDHRSYVDLPSAVSDVYWGDSWKSVLIGGGRAGVKGLFALDVTDPATFATNPSNVFLWEFTDTDAGGNLGYMTAEPLITLVKWGNGDYRWSAVFANGYGATSGKNGVFVLDINGGRSGWQSGVNFKFIELASGNGLSPIRVVDHVTEAGQTGSDGIADRLYAGDTEGRLWAVSLSGGSSSWGSAYNKPLFVAKDANGTVQPITAEPVVAENSYSIGAGSPNLLVFVGTGQYLSGGDITNTQVQSMYAVHDRGAADLTRSALTEKDLIQQTVAVPGEGSVELRKTEDVTINWASSYGWYIDFDKESGERIVNGAVVRGQHLVFNTLTPDATDPCGGGGSSWMMVVELNGSTSAQPVLDVTRNGKLNDNDAGWAGGKNTGSLLMDFGIIGNVLIGSGSDTSKPSFLTNLGSDFMTGRMSWREIILE